jgi:hypothetical protein
MSSINLKDILVQKNDDILDDFCQEMNVNSLIQISASMKQ